MEDNVAVIHNDPHRVGFAFGLRTITVFAHFILHVTADRTDVSIRCARANHEVVRDDGLAAYIENRDVERLEFVGSPANQGRFATRLFLFQFANIDWL
jgi:uncharacterized membrane protein